MSLTPPTPRSLRHPAGDDAYEALTLYWRERDVANRSIASVARDMIERQLRRGAHHDEDSRGCHALNIDPFEAHDRY